MRYKEIQKEIAELANRIDEWLQECEEKHKDKGKNYETLLYIAGGLHELEDVEID